MNKTLYYIVKFFLIILIFYFQASISEDEDDLGCTPVKGIQRCAHKSTNPKYPKAKKFTYSEHLISDRIFNNTKGKHLPDSKYYLSAMSMFKNEAGILKEWLNHHIGHGFEHFYLVNDHSSDDWEEVIQPFMKKVKDIPFKGRKNHPPPRTIDNEQGYITMFPAPWEGVDFRQVAVYNKLLTKIMQKNESFWVAIIDLDEFMWSPKEVDVRKVLKQHEALSVIGMNWLWFGSNHYIDQPEGGVVQSFTKRADYDMSKYLLQ